MSPIRSDPFLRSFDAHYSTSSTGNGRCYIGYAEVRVLKPRDGENTPKGGIIIWGAHRTISTFSRGIAGLTRRRELLVGPSEFGCHLYAATIQYNRIITMGTSFCSMMLGAMRGVSNFVLVSSLHHPNRKI